ncbi:hypothetical protein K435DRAFT_805932 [Dendrothele bispora CBS 962.96]|uniref:WD40 repeat-like protein n=1 Tax=Dendrothele bispora (strain CBS 962.96) TaxID=1314807 RepID=A0A4S8L9F3_DENBC|nr:hypothetical protein K435DRAFT_805932 [Dendrothele bispora CBS 962.96]
MSFPVYQPIIRLRSSIDIAAAASFSVDAKYVSVAGDSGVDVWVLPHPSLDVKFVGMRILNFICDSAVSSMAWFLFQENKRDVLVLGFESGEVFTEMSLQALGNTSVLCITPRQRVIEAGGWGDLAICLADGSVCSCSVTSNGTVAVNFCAELQLELPVFVQFCPQSGDLLVFSPSGPNMQKLDGETGLLICKVSGSKACFPLGSPDTWSTTITDMQSSDCEVINYIGSLDTGVPFAWGRNHVDLAEGGRVVIAGTMSGKIMVLGTPSGYLNQVFEDSVQGKLQAMATIAAQDRHLIVVAYGKSSLVANVVIFEKIITPESQSMSKQFGYCAVVVALLCLFYVIVVLST